MTNRPNPDLYQLRSQLWAEVTLARSGMRASALETYVLRRFVDPHADRTGAFRRYLKGARPFKSTAPVPDDATWVEHCDALWPGTSAWFYTPLWYLLEPREFGLNELLICVAVLPEAFWEELTADEDLNRLDLSLAVVGWPYLTELSHPTGPWALGALACAMRRLVIAGKTQNARRCAIGILWLIGQLIPTLPPKAGVALARTGDLLRTYLATPGYIAVQGFQVMQKELDDFEEARRAHLARCEELVGQWTEE